jgi:PhnB protein
MKGLLEGLTPDAGVAARQTPPVSKGGFMQGKVNAIPEGYRSLTPYLCVDDGNKAIEFYKRAFGATEVMRMGAPGGKVGHADLMIGDSHLMLADEFPSMDFRAPRSVGGTPVNILLYVENVDEVVPRAVAAGAKIVRPVRDEFYGDRTGQIQDPFGHVWHVSTHIEDVPPEEMEKRGAAVMAGAS